MDYSAIVSAVSSVGFPIVCCIVLFMQNDKLRTSVDENTKAIVSMTEFLKYKEDNLNERKHNEF